LVVRPGGLKNHDRGKKVDRGPVSDRRRPRCDNADRGSFLAHLLGCPRGEEVAVAPLDRRVALREKNCPAWGLFLRMESRSPLRSDPTCALRR
jgi:hypothetical protein